MLRGRWSEPATPEETRALIERMAQGDRAARDELIERNLPLVKFAAAKFLNTGIEYEELVSIGCIGLIDAIDRYNPARGAISTYAVHCVRSWILRELRRRRSLKRTGDVISLDAPLKQARGAGDRDKLVRDLILSLEPQPLEGIEEKEEQVAVRAAVATLPYELQRYLMARYGGDRKLTQGEAGRAVGWSQTWASRRERDALEMCRDAMAGGGFA